MDKKFHGHIWLLSDIKKQLLKKHLQFHKIATTSTKVMTMTLMRQFIPNSSTYHLQPGVVPSHKIFPQHSPIFCIFQPTETGHEG